MKILFINASPNKDGKTSLLAKQFLKKNEYITLNLIDYKIYAYGQNFSDDQFDDVMNQIKMNDVIVFGTPVYWHNICGLLRNLLDRTYGYLNKGELNGKQMFFICQGEAPEKWMLEVCEYTMKRFAYISGMKYEGMITNVNEADAASKMI